MTQPVFDSKQFIEFLRRIEHVRIPIVAGIWPLVSFQNAEFLNNEIPGAHVPNEILKRMKAAKNKQEARITGIQIARELLEELKPLIAGAQVSMPFGQVERPLEALRDVL